MMATRTRPQMTLETRAKLIELARRAFGEKGFAATSMDELTADAGLTRGALYHHFESKLGLFEAVVSRIDEELDIRLEAVAEAAGGGWDGFKASCRAYLHSVVATDIQRIMLHDAPSAIADFANRPRMQLCAASMADTLSKLMREGAIHKADPEALANLISGAVNKGAAWAASRDDTASAMTATQHAIDLLLEGMLPQ